MGEHDKNYSLYLNNLHAEMVTTLSGKKVTPRHRAIEMSNLNGSE